MKYIVFKDGSSRIFSKDAIHAYQATGREDQVASAGFCEVEIKSVGGESTTLGVKSRPEDKELLNNPV